VTGSELGYPGWLATVKSLPGSGLSYHATGVRGRLRFDRSLPKRDHVSLEAQGLSGEAVNGNPMTTVILGVDESKSSLRTTEDLTEPVPANAKGARKPGS